ncbi:hypothetical protein M9H77_12366 [Catharanthus roseus]|uniref:Uncharacterized protein n=1 Tax=Catharanthus roseus TaxID=4058 RepID=A0ACC0BH99_CATRO|nr:hypothetical protein M9H77_12366 [Catharanthus roseus]
MYYDPGAPGSSTQPPPIPFRTHSPTISYHLYTPVPYDPYGYYQPPQTSYDPYTHTPSLSIRMSGLDPTQHFSITQIPLNDVSGPGLHLGAQFFEQLAGSVPVDSSPSGAKYGATTRGNPSSDVGLVKLLGRSKKRPEKSHPPTNPTQRKKSKNDGWEQTGPVDGGPQDPVLVPLYSSHVAGSIWRGYSDLDISDSSIGVNGQDLAGVAESPRSGLSMEQRAACYVLYLLGSSFFTDKSGNNVSGKL